VLRRTATTRATLSPHLQYSILPITAELNLGAAGMSTQTGTAAAEVHGTTLIISQLNELYATVVPLTHAEVKRTTYSAMNDNQPRRVSLLF
jgi:hypothetical protein